MEGSLEAALLLQAYVDAFQKLLAALVEPESAPENASILERICNLMEELCHLQVGTCSVIPEVFTRFQHMNLAGEEEQRPPEGLWAHVVVSLSFASLSAAALTFLHVLYIITQEF